jgi:hypothetical protein
MAKKRIDIAVYDSLGQYMAKARDETGREVTQAYGKDRRDAIARCVEKVRKMYGSDAEVLYS